jgi:hypothetical protein
LDAYGLGKLKPQLAEGRADMAMMVAMAEVCAGLRHLSEGLRATYLLIEQQKRP